MEVVPGRKDRRWEVRLWYCAKVNDCSKSTSLNFTKFLIIAGSDNATLLKEYRMMKAMNTRMDDGINQKAQFASIKKQNKSMTIEIFLRQKNQKPQQCWWTWACSVHVYPCFRTLQTLLDIIAFTGVSYYFLFIYIHSLTLPCIMRHTYSHTSHSWSHYSTCSSLLSTFLAFSFTFSQAP